MISILRGLRFRVATNVLMLVVAVVAAAATAAAPSYYAASQASIMVDTSVAGPPLSRGIGLVESGSLVATIDPLVAQMSSDLSSDVGPGIARRDFSAPVEALESSAEDHLQNEDLPIVWRSGVCSHLVVRGACPTRAGDILISSSLVRANGWSIGQTVRLPPWGPLTVTGIYQPPVNPGDYWFDRASTYFAAEDPPAGGQAGPAFDAMFTSRATIEEAPIQTQGDTVVDLLLLPGRVIPSDIPALSSGVSALATDPTFSAENATVSSSIPATLHQVRQGWSALAVPLVVTTAQLLLLSWLLLFLLVSDSVDARGPEVALARLRGQRWWRVNRLILAEPVTVLVSALPLGVLGGWGAAHFLADRLLRPGTAVGVPGLAWAGSAAALAGGFLATLLASRRTLRRPVVEQWRSTGRRATDRGWVFDSVVVVAAAGGLVELFASGEVSSAGHQVLSLLVPGLLGLAVAVVASRILPVACRATARITARHGLASYLALRQIGRRPGGTRTTMLLITAVALATFGLSAWLVGQSNYERVARATVGAPGVLTVTIPQASDLATLVDRADPSGAGAAGVETYTSGNETTLAVQPERFASVASWSDAGQRREVSALLRRLHPSVPPPIAVNGDTIRVVVTAQRIGPRPAELIADVVTPTSTAPDPVDLGPVPADGQAALSGSMPGCPCEISDIQLGLVSPGLGPAASESGVLLVNSFDQHTSQGWMAVKGALDGSRWRPETPSGAVTGQAATGPSGLAWTFSAPSGQNPSLASADRPAILPAVVSRSLGARPGAEYHAVGLDGTALPVHVLAAVPTVPGAPAGGVVVDQDFSDLAATGDTLDAQDQVWVTAGAAGPVTRRLRSEGVVIVSSMTEAGTTKLLSRQGPALASVIYLADAAAAAGLGAVGALAALYAFGRRRTYEYAALVTVGLSRRAVIRSLVVEQGLVLGFALVVGIGAGAAAVASALRAVPEFVTSPAAPHLLYRPPLASLVLALAVMIAVLAAVSAGSGVALARRIRAEQLREGQA